MGVVKGEKNGTKDQGESQNLDTKSVRLQVVNEELNEDLRSLYYVRVSYRRNVREDGPFLHPLIYKLAWVVVRGLFRGISW